MGLRDLLTRAKSSNVMTHSESTATSASATTPSTSDAQKSSCRSSLPASCGSASRSTAASKQKLNNARLTQLVGDNPPLGSLARVVKRKYQSVAKERELEYSEDDCKKIDAIEQYEIEFPKNPLGREHVPLGIDLETDFYGKYTVVKEVKRGSVAYALSKKFIRPGHVVVAVNGVDLSQLSFQDVLHKLKHAVSPRVIRFLNPAVLPMELFKHEPVLVNRDQYGFAKDDKYILQYRKQLRKRKITRYEHEKKWAEFVNRHNGLDALDDRINSDEHYYDRFAKEQAASKTVLTQEFRSLVLSGVPVVLRPRIWSILAGVTRYRKKFGATYFQELLSQRDSSPTEKGKTELKNVLCAYSLHNPSIGYCQSMNFIAGMTLLFMDEEDAFWLLCVMLHKNYLPAANYTQSMVGTHTDQLVFKWLIDQELPGVAARLEACGIQIPLVTLHWFLCAFVCTLPTESALRVWDWFFLDGEEVLFTVAVGILKLAEDEILHAKTQSDVHTIVRGLGTDLHDDDEFMRFLHSTSSRSDGCESSVREGDGDHDDKAAAKRKDKQLETAAPMLFASPSPTKESPRLRSRLLPSKLQQLFQSFDSESANRDRFAQKFTIHDINEMRNEFRHQIESKSFPRVQEE
ncbi:Growth hormone-regulated tbc protein 1, partial [Globisporangium splendens]